MRLLASCAVGVIVAMSGLGLAAEPANEEGRRAFAAGVNFLQDPDGARYEDALLQFRRAYELTGSWKVLGNIGICSLKLERDGEAISAFEKYLASGGTGIDKEERAQVERDLSTLKAAVVMVHLVFPDAGGKVTDDRVNSRGQHVVNSYVAAGPSIDLGLHPGHHVLTARTAQSQETWEVDLEPGKSLQHAFFVTVPRADSTVVPPAETRSAAPPAPSVSDPSARALPTASATAGGPVPLRATDETASMPISVYVAGGLTGGFTLAAVVTGVMALGKRSDFNAMNGQPNHTQQEVEAAHDSATSLSLWNTALTGAAVVGAGATAYFYLTRSTTADTKKRGSVFAPWMTATGAGLSISGAL